MRKSLVCLVCVILRFIVLSSFAILDFPLSPFLFAPIPSPTNQPPKYALVRIPLTGSSASTDPRRRGCMSNCGGHLLVFCVVIVVILAFFMNFFTGIFFLFGSTTSKTCDVIQSDRIIKDVLDNPDNFGGKYLLSDLTNSSITIMQVVDGCRNNLGVWKAANLDTRFNLTDTLNINKQFNVSSYIDSIPTLNGTELVSSIALDLADQYATLNLGMYASGRGGEL